MVAPAPATVTPPVEAAQPATVRSTAAAKISRIAWRRCHRVDTRPRADTRLRAMVTVRLRAAAAPPSRTMQVRARRIRSSAMRRRIARMLQHRPVAAPMRARVAPCHPIPADAARLRRILAHAARHRRTLAHAASHRRTPLHVAQRLRMAAGAVRCRRIRVGAVRSPRAAAAAVTREPVRRIPAAAAEAAVRADTDPRASRLTHLPRVGFRSRRCRRRRRLRRHPLSRPGRAFGSLGHPWPSSHLGSCPSDLSHMGRLHSSGRRPGSASPAKPDSSQRALGNQPRELVMTAPSRIVFVTGVLSEISIRRCHCASSSA